MLFVVVDNNPKDLSQLADAITTLLPDSRIQTFTDPLLSAKYICNNPVDMVFLADAMRPANGFKLLNVLRKNIPALAVVMLSDSELNRIDAVHAGVNAYLLKPVSADLLGGVIKQPAVW